MKTTKQIKERINALELRQKDGLDLYFEIDSLTLCIQEYDLSFIKNELINCIDAMDLKGCRELLWVLED